MSLGVMREEVIEGVGGEDEVGRRGFKERNC